METRILLKKLRLQKKISTRELSRIFDMEESAISEIERGKRNLTIFTLLKYCNFFKVSADWLLGLSVRKEII